MKEVVSIIIPVYNVENYLDDLFDSLDNQTYTNLEIILVNDGSMDNSKTKCENFCKKQNRILVNKENGGLSSARNIGLKMSTGDYITFIDSDDYIHKDFIEKGMEIKNNTNADIVCFPFTTDKQSLGVGGGNVSLYTKRDVMESIILDKEITTSAWGKIYKKTLFDNIEFPEGRIYEDYATTYKIVNKTDKIAFCDLKYYYYRLNENSITHSVFSPKRMQYFIAAQEVNSFINHNYPDLKEKADNRDTFMAIIFYKQLISTKHYSKELANELRSIIKERIRGFLKSNKELRFKVFGILVCLTPCILKLYSKVGGKNERKSTNNINCCL